MDAQLAVPAGVRPASATVIPLPFDRRACARCCNPDGGVWSNAPTHACMCVCVCMCDELLVAVVVVLVLVLVLLLVLVLVVHSSNNYDQSAWQQSSILLFDPSAGLAPTQPTPRAPRAARLMMVR
ncbi:hypothetical protein N9L68_09470, partial [bacterium]|nr:hypothetical protein [bacterium]